MQEVHCDHQEGCQGFTWIQNGFIQCFAEEGGRRARIICFAPGQTLQPHKHDVDELFEIRGGAVLVSKWPKGEDGQREISHLKAGDLLEIPKDTPHALCCDLVHGLQVHEVVGEGEEVFVKRETQFLIRQGFDVAEW